MEERKSQKRKKRQGDESEEDSPARQWKKARKALEIDDSEEEFEDGNDSDAEDEEGREERETETEVAEEEDEEDEDFGSVAATTKRGRGRPRKSEAVKAEVTAPKRPRGRPRKTVAVEEDNNNGIKRGPGRPRKTIAVQNNGVKRGPGRPKKTEVPVRRKTKSTKKHTSAGESGSDSDSDSDSGEGEEESGDEGTHSIVSDEWSEPDNNSDDGWDDRRILVSMVNGEEREYTEIWTEYEDIKLLKKMPPILESLVDGMCLDEVALWIKSSLAFRTFPPDIIPGGIRVAISQGQTGSGSSDHFWRQARWSGRFCKYLALIITCPIFYNKPSYLGYVLAMALYHRIRKNSDMEKPRLHAHLYGNRDSRVLGAVKHKIRERGRGASIDTDFEDAVLETLKEELGADRPPHVRFLRELIHTTRKSKDSDVVEERELETSDLKAIIDAWSRYAKSRSKPLPTMRQYVRMFNLEHPVQPALPKNVSSPQWAKARKKEYVLSARRVDAYAKLRRAQSEESVEPPMKLRSSRKTAKPKPVAIISDDESQDIGPRREVSEDLDEEGNGDEHEESDFNTLFGQQGGQSYTLDDFESNSNPDGDKDNDFHINHSDADEQIGLGKEIVTELSDDAIEEGKGIGDLPRDEDDAHLISSPSDTEDQTESGKGHMAELSDDAIEEGKGIGDLPDEDDVNLLSSQSDAQGQIESGKGDIVDNATDREEGITEPPILPKGVGTMYETKVSTPVPLWQGWVKLCKANGLHAEVNPVIEGESDTVFDFDRPVASNKDSRWETGDKINSRSDFWYLSRSKIVQEADNNWC